MSSEEGVEAPSQEDIDRTRGYRVTSWRGYPNYECLYCQYATLWLNKMLDHLAQERHLWAYPGAAPGRDIPPPSGEPTY